MIITLPIYIGILLVLMIKFKLLKVDDVIARIYGVTGEILGVKALLKKTIFKNR